MSNKDDEDWLDILAGKNVPDANPNTVREAQTLNNALRAEGRLQRIVAQLEADGYIEPEYTSEPTFWERFKEAITGFWNRRIRPLWPIDPGINWKTTYLAGVHVVLVVAVTIAIYQWTLINAQSVAPVLSLIPKSSPPTTVSPKLPLQTSGTAHIITLDDNPQQVAKDLPEAFTLAGAEVQVFQVDIKIPETPSDDLQELCGNYGIDDLKAMSSSRVVRFIVSPEPQNSP